MKIKRFKNLGTMAVVLMTALLVAGCPNDKGGEDDTNADWRTVLKRELGCAKEQFFSNRYMRNDTDPFEVDPLIARIKVGEEVNVGIRRKLEDAARNQALFYDVGLKELEHIAKRYAVVSVIPAYLIADSKNESTAQSSCKPELLKAVVELEGLIKSGKVFVKSCRYKTIAFFAVEESEDGSTKARDITPRVEERVLTLSNQIASCGLQLEMAGNAQWSDVVVLNSYVRDGNMGGVNVTDPADIYAKLKPVYEEMFKILGKTVLTEQDLADVLAWRTAEKQLLIALREALRRQSDVAQKYLGK